jgi:hypothetical protein
MRTLSCLVVAAAAALAVARPDDADPWKLPADFKALKADDLKDAESTPPPAGAVVLFDGKDLSKWAKRNDGSEVKWVLRPNGVMEGVKGHGDVVTKEKFDGSFKLHVEFRVPYEAGGKGQGRGNSGVYVQGRYEVQILDSYGLQSKNNDCAAIYEVAAPARNVCKAPTVWQSYDIEFTAPKFENGKKTEPARMSVSHNGIKIHENVEIPVDNTRAGLGGDPSTPGPILLQDHGHPVQFRNIWLLPIK